MRTMATRTIVLVATTIAVGIALVIVLRSRHQATSGDMAIDGREASRRGAMALALAREAIGVGQVTDVRTATLKGTVKPMNGATGKLGPAQTLEARILPPDSCSQQITGPAVVQRSGFQGSRGFFEILPVRPEVRIGQPQLTGDQIAALSRAERERCAVLILGLLAVTNAVIPLEITTVREGKGVTAVSLTSSEGRAITVEIDRATKMPIHVRHEAEVRLPEPKTQTEKGRSSFITLPEPVQAEVTWVFHERHQRGGVRVPRQIARSARGILLEEIQIGDLQLNPD
jgi:hypothetical protein